MRGSVKKKNSERGVFAWSTIYFPPCSFFFRHGAFTFFLFLFFAIAVFFSHKSRLLESVVVQSAAAALRQGWKRRRSFFSFFFCEILNGKQLTDDQLFFFGRGNGAAQYMCVSIKEKCVGV